MINKNLYISSIETLLYSWGSDTPSEVIWGLNEQLDWLSKEYNIQFSNRFIEFADNSPILDELKIKL